MSDQKNNDIGSWKTPIMGAALLAAVAIGVVLDQRFECFEPVFAALTRFVHERSTLSGIRLPSQMAVARVHVAFFAGLLAAALIASRWMSRQTNRVFGLCLLGYSVRAGFWIVGGNLPLVPGDSAHYVEVATSVYRGEGPVKHYVESFFMDYRRHGILDGRGVLDDWATPLWAYVLAAAYRILGVVPGNSLDATFGVAKGASFLINWITLPIFYIFTRRWFGSRIATFALAVLAILPVHALYAGMALRESLVSFTSLVAVGALIETWRSRASWRWAIVAGVAGGLAILARNTGLALIGGAWLYALVGPGRRKGQIAPLLLVAVLIVVVITPWAWATYREYGEPFFTYTKYYPYNFSWTVHHFDQGNTRPEQFYRTENFPGILESKAKILAVIPAYACMILGLPLVLGFLVRIGRVRSSDTRDVDGLALFLFLVFGLATLVQVVDVTQVRQLGRYYLPVFLLMLPTAVAGLLAWADRHKLERSANRWLVITLAAVLWTGPGWAYDATWYVKPFQTRWPALREAGLWVREHPDEVPTDARILTWFPWELRVTSDRTTILFPRALEGGSYELARLQDAIQRYRPTHVLWGSFEPMPESDPESLGRYLEALRADLGVRESDLLYTSPPRVPHPVRLYRLRGTGAL